MRGGSSIDLTYFDLSYDTFNLLSFFIKKRKTE